MAVVSSKSPTFVTGASGFIGSAVVRALLGSGFAVRALVRPSSPRTNLAGLEVEIAEGDMRDPEVVGRAAKGARYVLHVAADYRLWARNPQQIMHNNIEGTRVVMQAAKAAGAERIVYTSSVATLKPAELGRLANETNSLAEQEAIGSYKRSKVAAERIVASMIEEHRLPAVIVNPTAPVGPRDLRPTPTGRIIVEAARGRMPAFIDTGLNLVHVDDVAAGHVAALRRGRVGERYILGGENMTLAEMLARIARLVGRRPPRLSLPRQLIYPLAYAAEAAARITDREPFVTLDGLRMAKVRMFFSSGKAEQELGYNARPADAAISDAVQWFRDAGYIQ
jgi:dihydroflavonol-4-reductase